MTTTADLYELLPTFRRLADAEAGEMLEALVSVLAGQAHVVDRDIEDLYDNWFIETCDPWVVPYVGDLLRVRPLYGVVPGTASPRAYVANTLGYRRRKGTLAVLEQLAFDVTGWRAKAVEFFQLLETTQYAKHVRLGNLRTPDLRQANELELLGGPFERATHTLEVRSIRRHGGRYNIPNVGLFLWRLQSYPLTRATARRVGTPAAGRFTFNSLGLDAPVFNRPRTEEQIADLAGEVDVPAPLRRRPLFDELEARRQTAVDGIEASAVYFADQPVLRVFVKPTAAAAFDPVAPEKILIADLGLWQRPPASKDYTPTGSTTAQPLDIGVAVDPVLGRLTFPPGVSPNAVEVSYAYGFSDDVGGGPSDRTPLLDRSFAERVQWQAGVGTDVTPVADRLFTQLAKAVEAWNAKPAGTVGVIAILDSRSYQESLTGSDAIEIKEGSELLIVAADWPEEDVLGTPTRLLGRWVPQGLRPHLLGDVAVVGTAAADSDVPGRLRLEGLLVEGSVGVLPGNLGRLEVVDSTLVPAGGGIEAQATDADGQRNADLRIELDRTICGPLDLPATVPELGVTDSVVDAGAAAAVAAPGSAVDFRAATIFGSVAVRSLRAEDSIFTGVVEAERRQLGCVRFCFVRADPATRTPRRYRCQPDLALRDVQDPAEKVNVLARLVPTFTSTGYGNPGYAQLARTCPAEIRTGAENGAEMGVFNRLQQPQREANLSTVLDEYLRFGLEAGVFFPT